MQLPSCMYKTPHFVEQGNKLSESNVMAHNTEFQQFRITYDE